MAGAPGFGGLGCIFRCRTLHGFCEGCGFFFPAEYAAREERTQWHRLQSVWFRSSQMGRTSQDQSETHRLKSMLPASGKGRIEDQKTRTLERHKSAAPKVQIRSKAGAPGRKVKVVQRLGHPPVPTLRGLLRGR
jgi:hypothetical protein